MVSSPAQGDNAKKKKSVRFQPEEKLRQVRIFEQTDAPQAISLNYMRSDHLKPTLQDFQRQEFLPQVAPIAADLSEQIAWQPPRRKIFIN